MGIGQSHLKEVCARILLTTAEDVGIPEKTAPTTASLSTSAENDGSDKSPMDCLPMTHCDVVCSLLASRDYEVRLVALQHLSTNLSPFFVSLPRVHKPADILKDEEANEIFEREDLRGIASTLLEMAVGKEKHLDCLGQVRVLSFVCIFSLFVCLFVIVCLSVCLFTCFILFLFVCLLFDRLFACLILWLHVCLYLCVYVFFCFFVCSLFG